MTSNDTNEYDPKVIEIVKDLGVFILKTLVTINSGGAVVMLTFVGNARQHNIFPVDIEHIRISMLSFCAGVFFSMCLAFIAYVRNVRIVIKKSDATNAHTYLVVYVLMALISLACFCYGVISISFSVSS